MKRTVFSDIDGTLLNSEQRITQKTKYALGELKKNGIPFVIVSARSPGGIFSVMKDNGINCPIISFSGALIMDESRKILYQNGFCKSDARRILNYIESGSFDVAVNIYSPARWITKDRSDPRIVREEQTVKICSEEGTLDILDGDEICKILCIGEPNVISALEKSLKENFFDFEIVRSADFMLEIMQGGVNKAEAVKKLCEIWGVSPKDAAAFGDNYNDREMLLAVGNGYLMDNAPAELKAQIKKHTKDNNRDGIYYALAELGFINE